MSRIKCKAEISFIIDTEDYPIPADGRIAMSLRDEVEEVFEAGLEAEIIYVKVTKSGKIYNDDDEIRDQDY